MTQKAFAKYLGVSQGMVSKWEGGDYNFSIKTLAEIAEKLDMELAVNLDSRGLVMGKVTAQNLSDGLAGILADDNTDN